MSPNAIRLIDKYLGQPICFLLTAIRYIVPSRKPRQPKSILFLKLIEQGATVLAFSSMKRAVELVGKENVYFCVFKENSPILDIIGLIPKENVIEIRHSNIFIFAYDILGFFLKSRSKGIDSTVDMEFFSRAAAILAYLSGARNRVGLHRFNSELPYRGDLMTHKVQYNPYLHISKAYLSLVEVLAEESLELPFYKRPADSLLVEMPAFMPSDDEVEAVKSLLEEKLGRTISFPIILLNPNASDMLPLRRWPTERFVDLGKKLLEEKPDAVLALTGAPSEKRACEEIRKEFSDDRVISVAGFTSLRELIVLYSLSNVLITNDSGPGHFASLTRIDTIVLFGPETPELFAPMGEHIHVIWKKLACSPCVNAFNHRFSPCKDNLCMQKITVDEVFNKALTLI